MSKFSKVMLAAVVASCGFTAAANAATVTFTLALNDAGTGAVSAGKWALYADVSAGDNAGLASYGVALLNYSAPLSRTPTGQFTDSSFTNPDSNVGFNTLRTANTSSPLSASLNTVGGADEIITGFGQQSFTMLARAIADGFDGYTNFGGSTATQSPAAHLLLNSGTFNSANPVAFDLSVNGLNNTKANVLAQGTVDHIGTANTANATIVRNVINLIDTGTGTGPGTTTGPVNTGTGPDTGPGTGPTTPEPASLALLGLGAAALMIRRKKA